MYPRHRRSGFTLIELLVVISIIGVILSILTASFSQVRESGRDKRRINDLAQVEFALNAYRELEGDYPPYGASNEGVILGHTTARALETDLQNFWERTPVDPLHDGTHEYVYSSDFTCNGERYIAIIATHIEKENGGNAVAFCGAEVAYPNGYIVLVDGPLMAGNSLNEGVATGDEWWNEPQEWTNVGEGESAQNSFYGF